MAKRTFRQDNIEYRRQRAWGICDCHHEFVADVKRHGTCLSGTCPHAWRVRLGEAGNA